MTSPGYIPYKLRAGEEGYFKPVEMSKLEIFVEITAFEHAYYLNNCDPAFRDYMLYAGSATGKLLANQPGFVGDYEGTLEHWKGELRAMGAELDIYGFSVLHKDTKLRPSGKAEVGFIVFAESRRHPAKAFYVPLLDADEVVASGKEIHPMFRSWMPGGIHPIESPQGWFLLNDEQGNPLPSAPAREQREEFVSFGPVEMALRNLGNVLFESAEPFHAALILSFAGAEDRHLMIEAEDLETLHHKVWDELHNQAEASDAFRGYCFAVDAYLTGESEARNKVYLVQSESAAKGVPTTLKGYKMMELRMGDRPIALMQAMNTPPVFERPPVRTLFVQD
jgi:hypothetical protein